MTPNVRRAWAGVLLVASVAVWPAALAAEDSLTAARDLYAAAAYEDALAALERLRAGGVRVEDGKAVEQYRAFCLLALGKSSEATQAIEAVVSADPWYHPSESDVSPRVRSAFSDVRRRLLPDLAQQKYAQAKAAFDRKDYRIAAESFGQLLDLFADPDLAPAAGKPPLTDLRTLALGFRDLSAQAMAPPPAPVAPAPPPAATAAAAPPPSIPAPQPPRIYASSDANVLPPAVIRQDLPPFAGASFKSMLGMIEVVVDENGAVVSAAIRAPMQPLYDRQVLAAAATWRYKPALLDGMPVRYRKFIQIAVTPK
jgi:hypothetical protein